MICVRCSSLSSIKVSAVCTNLLNDGTNESHEGDEGDEGHPVCAFYVPYICANCRILA